MKRKQEDEQSNYYGDGGPWLRGPWLRGPMIGKGSFGSVYLATLKKPKSRCSFLPPIVAVKSAEVSVSGSIQKEKEVLDNVRGCPYVLRCFGEETTTDKNDNMIYNLFLEYAFGGTLDNLIEKTGGRGMSESDVRRYTRSILQGLSHIHDSGFVHCDLKPDNILLVRTGDKFMAKIGDFGLAKRFSQSNKKRRRIDPYLRGTPMYLSPEAVVDNIQDPPSDIWALGCVVLEMLTGKPAWAGDGHSDCEGLLSRIGNGYELPKIPSEISKEVKDFLQGCFVRKPMYRFTAEMLLNHPFVAGLHEEGEVQEFDEVSDAESDCYTSSDDDEVLCSSCSDDWSYTTKLHPPSSSSSWSQEAEMLNVELLSGSVEEAILGIQTRKDVISSSLIPKDHHVFFTSSKPAQLYQPAFIMQAGA